MSCTSGNTARIFFFFVISLTSCLQILGAQRCVNVLLRGPFFVCLSVDSTNRCFCFVFISVFVLMITKRIEKNGSRSGRSDFFFLSYFLSSPPSSSSNLDCRPCADLNRTGKDFFFLFSMLHRAHAEVELFIFVPYVRHGIMPENKDAAIIY